MTQSFEAQIKKATDRQKEAMLAIAQQSIQEVVEIAQTPKDKGGRIPVVTSFLRNSLASGLNGSFGEKAPDSYILTIANLKLGDTSRFAWTAAYAMRMELGFSGPDSLGRVYEQQGNFFVSNAASQWQDIVAKNARRVQ